MTEPAVVAGTALGGGYAIALAAREPERVARLVATSPALFLEQTLTFLKGA